MKGWSISCWTAFIMMAALAGCSPGGGGSDSDGNQQSRALVFSEVNAAPQSASSLGEELAEAPSPAAIAETIDFSKFRQALPRTPALIAQPSRYGIYLFGEKADHPVWAILDKQSKASATYDLLYLDLNGDGDLTAPEERFVGTVAAVRPGASGEVQQSFQIGQFAEPGSDRTHTDFSVKWWGNRVSFRMKWRGEHWFMGGYGNDPETYGDFSTTPEAAPVFVISLERPLQFQHWMTGTLKRNQENDFKVFIGNIGSSPGTFTCVDDKFLPSNDFVFATLICKDEAGQQQAVRYKLNRRC